MHHRLTLLVVLLASVNAALAQSQQQQPAFRAGRATVAVPVSVFDAYGNGLIARLCASRGWLLVAVRNGRVDGVVEELARRYPVDTKRVFLVGHSMGAQQSVALASANPERFAAVAALAQPFATVKKSDRLAEVAFFVGVGKEDFTVPGARSLKRALENAAIRQAQDAA